MVDHTDAAALSRHLDRLAETVRHLESHLKELASKLDRQQQRIEAIEAHPPFPLEQPARHYATETQSVSMAKRKRLGHLG